MILLSDARRRRHVYIIGKTWTGKSTLMLNALRQDLLKGKGACFINPRGNAAEEALKLVPRARLSDVIYFEPIHYPVGLQTLATRSETETELLCGDLVTLFRRLSEGWGDRMDALFRFGFKTLIKTPGSTLLDLYDLLTDDDFRAKAVSGLTEPRLIRFWTREYAKLPKDSAAPILLRLSKFVTSAMLTRIFGTTHTIDLSEIMDNRRVLIVNLSLVDDDTRAILGTIIVTMIQIAAMRRAHLPPTNRVPFYLYVDEFERFASASFETILSESAKFGLRLTLAHQFISQIEGKMRSAILGNVGTIIAFELGIDDAEIIDRYTGYQPPKERHWVGASGERTMHIPAHGYSTLTLPKYHAIVKSGTKAVRFRTRPLRVPREHHAEEIKSRMREAAPSARRDAAVAVPPVPPDIEVAPSPPPRK